MDAQQFSYAAKTAAELYLQYLDYQSQNKNRFAGRKVVSVYHIEASALQSDFVLTISEKITSPDSCEIWIRDKQAEKVKITKVLRSVQRMHKVVVRNEMPESVNFQQLSAADILIVSDLRFLIKRLKEFYENAKLNLDPPAPGFLLPLPDHLTANLSKEQLQAVDGVCQSPVSYVWGAPGTGKTQMVLSRCILRYILSGKRVFLLAPTNNAVEQMLRSILPILSDAGLDLRTVYRIGTSSEEFAIQYPDVVGSAVLEELQSSLLEEKRYWESKVESIRAYEHECSQRKSELKEVHAAVSEIIYLNKLLCAVISDQNSLRALLEQRRDATVSAREELQSAGTDAKLAESQLHACENAISQNDYLILKWKHRFWKKKERDKLIAENKTLLLSLAGYKIKYEEAAENEELCRSKLKDAEELLKICEEDLHNSVSRSRDLLDDILDGATFNRTLLSICSVLEEEPTQDISEELESYCASLEATYQSTLECMSDITIETAQNKLQDIMARLSSLGNTEKLSQKRNALVLAGTIDSSLNDLSPKEGAPVSHVFIDEAGYTSLVRGMTAFTCSAPVAFFGDHLQLPPICEMNRIEQDCLEVCLWSLSVVYYSNLRTGNMDSLFWECYKSQAFPSFSCLNYYELNLSYRFGELLAGVLGRFIYSAKFQGVSSSDFEIVIIDAPSAAGHLPRSSLSEAKGIAAYLEKNPTLDASVLAPYNNQIKTLKQVVPAGFQNRVLTIHRSQGREWDTVILSVTDAENPYFTDSSKPLGRSVLNTAISRAKHRLVLVCDVEKWKRKDGQIITELIRLGRPAWPREDKVPAIPARTYQIID